MKEILTTNAIVVHDKILKLNTEKCFIFKNYDITKYSKVPVL